MAHAAAQVQIKFTFSTSRHIALEAAKRGVRAYVRLQLPFYECKEKGAHDEKEDVKPEGVRGLWWHETLRMLASIPEYVCRSWSRVRVRTAYAAGLA